MDKVTLVDRLQFLLNNNDGQTDQDFSAARLQDALNWVYRQEVNKAQTEVSKRWFMTYKNITWPASQTTLKLPADVEDKGLIKVVDVTDTDPGYPLLFDENGYAGDVFWNGRRELQWGTSGPSAAKTLRFTYFAVPTDLVEDDDVPELIPEQFHELLIWGAAIFLLEVADERAPQSWYQNRLESRLDMWKFMSRGRPMSDTPTARISYPDVDIGIVY